MFSKTVLFSVLSVMIGFVSASPLPMPAAKQSQDLAARFYRHDPVWLDGTPCWHRDRFGYLKDRNCDLVDADIDVGLVKRKGGIPFATGDPCWKDNKFGSIDGAVCVVAEINVKRGYTPFPYGQPVWLDGTPCWRGGKFGYLKDRSCGLLDVDLDLDLLDLGHKNRYYHPYFVDGTPCWIEDRFGYVHDSTCAAIDVATDLSILKRGAYTLTPSGQPFFQDYSPCYENGRFGYFRDVLCIFADLDLDVGHVKKSLVPGRQPIWTDGTPCWASGRFGYLKDKSCSLVDADLAVGLKKRDWYPTFVDGEPCWNEDQFGYINEGACLIDIEATITKRLIGDDSVVGELLGGPRYRFANSHPNNVPPPQPLLGVAGLKRNGLLHHSPDGSPLNSILKSGDQLVGHSVTKRTLLDNHRGPLYKPGYFDDDDVVANLESDIDLGHGRPLGLKRTLGPLDGVTGMMGNKGGKGQGKGQGGLGGVTGLLG